MQRGIVFITMIAIISAFFLGILTSCQERDDFGEIREPPELIKPETERNYCNELPVLEWTPVKYADRYEIFIDEKLIDEVLHDPKVLNDDGNYTYDFNEKEHLSNLKNKLCGNNIDTSHKMCPYSPVVENEESKTIIQPYTWYIRATHEFQYEPSREKRTFTYNDCIKPQLKINNPTPGMEIQEGKLKIKGVASDDETEIISIKIQFDAGEVTNIELEKSYNPESKEFSFEIDTSDLPVGKHIVTVYVTDLFGNTTQVKVPVEIKPTAPEPITPQGEICNPKPRFTWTEIDGINMYHLQISTDSTFENIEFNIPGVVGTSYDMITPLTNWTTYYWRVRSQDGSFFSEWSEVIGFNVAAIPTTTLKYPPDGSVSVSPKPTFVWEPSPSGGNTYRIEFSYDDTFSTTFYTAEVSNTTTFSQPDPMPSGNLYWRVQVVQGSCESPWSDPWLLVVDTICIPDMIPNICTPNIYCDTTLTITWDATCKDYLVGYVISYSDNPGFSSGSGNVYTTAVPKDQLSFTTTKKPESGVFNLETEGTMPITNGTYFIRIGSFDGGVVSDPFECEIQVSGILNQTDTLNVISNPCVTLPTFEWNDSTLAPGADRYRLQISNENPGVNPNAFANDSAVVAFGGDNPYLTNGTDDLDENGTTDSFVTPTDNTTFNLPVGFDLSAGSTPTGQNYWFRIRGESGSAGTFCASPWSTPFQFTILDIGGVPSLQTPINPPSPHESCKENPDFTWTAPPVVISRTDKYRLELTQNSTATLPDGSFVTTNYEFEGNVFNYTYAGSLADGIYYWHVRAENATCDGGYSTIWAYKVRRFDGITINDDGPTYCTGSTPNLEWTLVADYDPVIDINYYIEIDNEATFTAPLYTSTNYNHSSGNTTWAPSTAFVNDVYHWRVRLNYPVVLTG